MAEQYISAFAIDADGFHGMVGSGDDALVRAALGRIEGLREDDRLLRATTPAEVEPALREIVDGRLDPSRPGGYGWLLELLGPTAGEPLGSVVLPGRGWHRLRKAFRAWDLPALARLWKRPWAFPWRDAAPDRDPWPFPMLASKAELDRVHAELAGFDTDRIHDDYDLLPSGDDDDAEEAAWLVGEQLPAWVDGARGRGRELLLIRDGGK
ncbi:hypothetical protein GCM10010399_36420 [Dactylosporangium fulvum]|uniref:DUF7691 domain-containing protein n=1 Tax=Dactylosporangium fulvum TaxID=53359 RepID=A0ABY5WA93_9ACTN|nr:hypothetical protein [Dactylosporangium fulvum]UWP86409.1 hypothetical protein Dfulv_20070 [Dactylosporangium fulvum]